MMSRTREIKKQAVSGSLLQSREIDENGERDEGDGGQEEEDLKFKHCTFSEQRQFHVFTYYRKIRK